MLARNPGAFLRNEHSRINELLDRLHQTVAVVPRGDVEPWIAHIRDQFDVLRTRLLEHMAMEESDGYLKAVVDRRPGFASRVDRLRHEHLEFEVLLNDLAARLAQLKSNDRLLARDWCRRMSDLVHYIEHHESEENDLMEFAYTQDFGAKD